MRIVSHVRLAIPNLTEMPEEIVNLWSATQKARAEYTAEKCLEVIKDSDAFQLRLAEPSNKAFAEFVNPDFCSRSGLKADEVIARQASNLKTSYQKYDSGVKHAYSEVEGVPAKRFKERVDLRRAAYSAGAARKLLSFTGRRASGIGAVPIAVAWLVGDQKIVGYLRASDSLSEGAPFCIVELTHRPGFKANLNQRLIQAGANIVDGGNKPEVVKHQNDLTNSLVQGAVNQALNLAEFRTGGDSYVDYIIPEEKGQLYLEIKVSQG